VTVAFRSAALRGQEVAVPTLLSRPRRAFSLLSLLTAGASLSASCALDLNGVGAGGSTSSASNSSTGGGMMVCTPNEMRHCYGGFTETEGKGTCKGGEQTCKDDGSGFGDCVGEVMPAMTDDCTNSLDTTCDNKLSCPCKPKDTQVCYDGMPATTAGVGICKSGMRTCSDDGKGFGECVGQVKPAAEDCTTQADENCDGMVNEMASGCVCDPTMGKSDCTGTLLGVCANGTHMCAADGKSYSECIPKLMPSFEDCFTPEDEDCDGMPAVACTGGSIKAAAPSVPMNDEIVFDIASDAMGNIIFGGVSGSSGGSNYGVTSGAADITKLDKNGMQLWKYSYPAPGMNNYSVVHGIAVDGMGSIVLIGEYQGTISANGVSLPATAPTNPDVFVIKLDKDGALKWSKSFGGNGDQFGAGVATAASGDVFITGTMSGSMTFGSSTLNVSGSPDVFVAKLEAATGNPIWSKNFGDGDIQFGRQVAVTSDGNVVVTGQFRGGIDFGAANIASAGNWDIFLAKLDGNDGKKVWSKGFGDNADQISYSLAVDSKDNIVITGTLQGTTNFGVGDLTASVTGSDVFVARFTSDGGHLWSKRFGDSNYAQTSRDVAVDGAGNVLITGYFKGALTFEGTTLNDSANNSAQETDVFVAKLKSSDGSLGWARSFGDKDYQVAWAVASDPLGNVIFGGTYQGKIDFGPPVGSFTNTSMTSYDAFWAKLAP
jgi:Beta-propeller repeat